MFEIETETESLGSVLDLEFACCDHAGVCRGRDGECVLVEVYETVEHHLALQSATAAYGVQVS